MLMSAISWRPPVPAILVSTTPVPALLSVVSLQQVDLIEPTRIALAGLFGPMP
jgi:hypothetical protein